MDTRRDFIYIGDLIEVVMMAIDGNGNKGFYHVSSGFDYSIKELFDATVQALNIIPTPDVQVRPRSPDDVFTILLDPSKTNQDFGWEAKTNLQIGARRAIEWYRQYGIEQTYTHLRQAEMSK